MAEWRHAGGNIHSYCGCTNGSFPVTNISDGSTDAQWVCHSNHKHWVIMDLGAAYEISQVRQDHRGNPGGRWYGVEVYIGNDPNDLGDPVLQNQSFPTDWAWNVKDVSPAKVGRYVKFADISTGGAGGYFSDANEIQAYGDPPPAEATPYSFVM